MRQLVLSIITAVSILSLGARSTPIKSAKDINVTVSITGEQESLRTIVTNLTKELYKGSESSILTSRIWIIQERIIVKGSFVKYVTRKGGGGSSVALQSYLKTWVKCGKPVTIGGIGKKKSKNSDTYFTNDPQMKLTIWIWMNQISASLQFFFNFKKQSPSRPSRIQWVRSS